VQPVLPPGTVHVRAVFALPTRNVNVRVSANPGATVSVTARSLAVIVAFGVNELTLFSFPLAPNWPDGARKLVPAGTPVPRPSTAPKAGLPAAPGAPSGPRSPRGPRSPCGPRGRLPALKSLALSDPRLTFAPVTAFEAISGFLTAPLRICVHADLATTPVLAAADQHCAAAGMEIALGQGQSLLDAQPGSPHDHDQSAKATAVRGVAGSAHDGDDLFDLRRIGPVTQALVAWSVSCRGIPESSPAIDVDRHDRAEART
jgi:hypothetical protein